MSRFSDVTSRARTRWGALPRWVRWPTYGFAGLVGLGVALLALLWITVDLPEDPPELRSAVVLAASGDEIAVLSKDGQRFEVGLDEVAPVFIDALIAAEDRRFYSHSGLDPIGITRALWSNVRSSGTQGGSTLTQQLVKNEYLTSERTLWRKAREAVLAAKLERTADKDEILARYLNTVYFGRGAYGVEAAARVYFDTSAAKLDLQQAALLVGLLRAPTSADPAEHPDVAEQRRATVLGHMVDTGDITQEEADAAAAAPIDAQDRVPQATDLTAGLAPHFVEWVRQETVEHVGEDALYGRGLVVHTTIDLKAQAAAEQAVAEVLTDPEAPQAALVALDADGAIRAHVGGRDFDDLQVDLVRGGEGGGTGRQPGSTFKPFVLQAALEQGVTLADRYRAPAEIELTVDGEPWTVSNYGGTELGEQTVSEATAASANTVYAQLAVEVGPDAIADAAARAGIDAELEPFPAIALGVEEVSPLDLASAYLTYANDGTRAQPYGIVRIEDGDGNVLWEPDRPGPEEAVSPEVVRAVNRALQAVIDDGTGTAAGIGRPAAGKTGTTQENVDAWFAGYVPGYTAVVWMGYPEPAPMSDVQGRSVTGGSFPAEIWQRFMTVAVEDREPEDFPPPPDELVTERTTTTTIDPRATTTTEPSTTTTEEETDEGDDDATTTTTEDEGTTTTRPGQGSTTTTTATTTTSTTTTAPPDDDEEAAPPP